METKDPSELEPEFQFVPIGKFPDEVLAAIFLWVNLVDLFALRCVCRRFKNIGCDKVLNLRLRVAKRNAIATVTEERMILLAYTDIRKTRTIRVCSVCKDICTAWTAYPKPEFNFTPQCIYTCSMCKLTLCKKMLSGYVIKTPDPKIEGAVVISVACEDCYKAFTCVWCHCTASRLEEYCKCHSCDGLFCARCMRDRADCKSRNSCGICNTNEPTCEDCLLSKKCPLLVTNKFGNLQGPLGIVFRRETIKCSNTSGGGFTARGIFITWEETKLIAIGMQNPKSNTKGNKSLTPLTHEALEWIGGEKRGIGVDTTVVRRPPKQRKKTTYTKLYSEKRSL